MTCKTPVKHILRCFGPVALPIETKHFHQQNYAGRQKKKNGKRRQRPKPQAQGDKKRWKLKSAERGFFWDKTETADVKVIENHTF